MAEYVLGVDGGNSKAEYFLFTPDGTMVDGLRDGTCSHEQFDNDYRVTKTVIGKAVGALLERNGLTLGHIAASAFGLAGADHPEQKENLRRILRELGFARFALDNDGFLGIKAGCRQGYGICTIAGSGCVTVGIGVDGQRLQVGGVGADISGDEGGGHYLSRRVVRCVYDALYRMGDETALVPELFEMLGVSAPDHFLQTACGLMQARQFPVTDAVRLLFAQSEKGDEVARRILTDCALSAAQSTLGCIRRLSFPQGVTIVQAGSVWAKTGDSLLHRRYRQAVQSGLQIPCEFQVLREPPATGAALWALELYHGRPMDEAAFERVFASVRRFYADCG